MRLRSGRPSVFPSPEEAAAYPWTPRELAAAEAATASHIVGSPATVRAGLDALLDETDADELMVVTNVHRTADRIRSYELVAELGGLTGGAGAAVPAHPTATSVAASASPAVPANPADAANPAARATSG
jgi:hypothetical protein